MSKPFLHIRGLNFSYPQSIDSIFSNFELSLSEGWTAMAGANGGGKTTLLRLITGELQASTGKIQRPGKTLYCSQEVHQPPPELEDFFMELYSGNNIAGRLFGRLKMEHQWPYRWDTLSFGERKRAQLASALLQDPALLALDEPTNHLDEQARQLIEQILKEYRGVGLLVSHDRNLLDNLCSQTLILGKGEPRLFKGNWSRAMEQQNHESRAQQLRYVEFKKEERRLKREVQRRKEEAEKHKKDFSKKHLDPKDHDGKRKIDAMRLAGKDVMGGKLVKAMDNRLQNFQKDIEGPVKKGKLGVTLNALEFKGDYFFKLIKQSIPLGEERSLKIPELELRSNERIALRGVNGGGKSTLIRFILTRGNLTEGNHLYLPQEIPPAEQMELLYQFHGLEDKQQGEVLSHYSRLNGQPVNLKDSARPSPGEMRKLALSMAFFRACPLLILDEPTNHLDLPSMLALEEALENYEGALLLVSHDTVFRDKLTDRSWEITQDNQGLSTLRVC
ncbi:MAG: ATP-binding cassette domain-containing protein [Spirochaetaceae bacterium]|jgi:macrolide transport system ATP-binding/permease protein|nr:ATP-binding cassette domain-containing protein [Spirochaetaceae bacterium]